MANALQLCRRGGSASRPAERGRLTADLKPLQQAGAETAVVPAAFRQVPRADQRNHFRAPGRVRADGNDVGTAGTRMLDSVASFGQENGANGPSSQAWQALIVLITGVVPLMTTSSPFLEALWMTTVAGPEPVPETLVGAGRRRGWALLANERSVRTWPRVAVSASAGAGSRAGAVV